MKVYLTRNALTKGIIEVDAEIDRDIGNGEMITFKNEYGYVIHEHKPHWHTTRKEAEDRFITMKARKISALLKQISRLEKLQP